MNRVFISPRAKHGRRTQLEEDVQKEQRHAGSAPSAALWGNTLYTFWATGLAKKVVSCPLLTLEKAALFLCRRLEKSSEC